MVFNDDWGSNAPTDPHLGSYGYLSSVAVFHLMAEKTDQGKQSQNQKKTCAFTDHGCRHSHVWGQSRVNARKECVLLFCKERRRNKKGTAATTTRDARE